MKPLLKQAAWHSTPQALNEAQIGDRDFDNVIEDLGKYKAVPCYVAQPALVRASAKGFPSNTEVVGRDQLAR